MRTLPLLLALALVAPTSPVAAQGAMARIPAGRYMPLYDRGEGEVRVAAFRVDRTPVTRGEYLAFVKANPQWRRGAVKPVFADAGYLADWAAPLDAGRGADLRRPVVNVSWFAAKAYCAAQGKRLPTVDEWEYVAAAGEKVADASRDPMHAQRVLELTTRSRPRPLPEVGHLPANHHGVRDLHGLVWEWTRDFNSVMVADDSRATAARDIKLNCASGAVGATNVRDYAAFLRYAFRAGLEARSTQGTLGFRCAASA
ncbi:MAG TPA: formylglycine-generating enzyme family protein [Gemmatimonadales bacterium]